MSEKRVFAKLTEGEVSTIDNYCAVYSIPRQSMVTLLCRVGLDALTGEGETALNRVRALAGVRSSVPVLGMLSERVYVCPGCYRELERDGGGDWVCADCQYIQPGGSK